MVCLYFHDILAVLWHFCHAVLVPCLVFWWKLMILRSSLLLCFLGRVQERGHWMEVHWLWLGFTALYWSSREGEWNSSRVVLQVKTVICRDTAQSSGKNEYYVSVTLSLWLIVCPLAFCNLLYLNNGLFQNVNHFNGPLLWHKSALVA